MKLKDKKETAVNEDSDDNEKNYQSEGLMYGSAIGIVIGAAIGGVTSQYLYLLFGPVIGMCIGLAVGSSMKKTDDKDVG
jgi:outer membrane lipoprotein SlyB